MCKHFDNGPEFRTSSWSPKHVLQRSKTLLADTFLRHICRPESDTLFGSDNTLFCLVSVHHAIALQASSRILRYLQTKLALLVLHVEWSHSPQWCTGS